LQQNAVLKLLRLNLEIFFGKSLKLKLDIFVAVLTIRVAHSKETCKATPHTASFKVVVVKVDDKAS